MELSNLGVPYYLVRFEDLFAVPSGKAEFVRLFEFIGLPSVDIPENRHSQKINQTTKKNFPHWTEWNHELCVRMAQQCGQLMHLFGYGQERLWELKLKGMK